MKRRPPSDKVCLVCAGGFKTYQRGQSFCSLTCRDAEYRNRKGEDASAWRGEEVSYNGLHKWLAYTYEKPTSCEHCGESKKLDWANKTGLYLREREDWLGLCRACHRMYDDAMEKQTGKKASKITV